jgi:hypothetical protein
MSDPYAGYSMPASSFVQFETPGDSITGQLVNVREGTFEGDTRPLLDLKLGDGSEVTVNCGPRNLRRTVLTDRYPLGTVLTITFTKLEGRSKLFDVTVAQPATAMAAPAPATGFAPTPAPGGGAPWGTAA